MGPRYWLQFTAPQVRALRQGTVLRAVSRQARRVLLPLTRTDAGVTTLVYTPPKRRRRR